MSQEDLAELSKVNLRTIQRIENNETTPKEKTLKLIYDALDIVVIDNEKIKIDKYIIWSSSLTLLIIISTFLGWLRFFKEYVDGNALYSTSNGWEGITNLNGYRLDNWLLSLSTITVGLIVVSHSLGLIKNKLKYIAMQIVILFLYVSGIFSWSHVQGFDLRPGLFILVIATILLIIAYRKKDRKPGANIVYK